MDYVIRAGDTLFAIARRFGVSLDQLLAANPQITNPNQLSVGQHLTIPTAPGPSPTPGVYIVQPGDTLNAIARRFGITLGQLLAANPQIIDPNRLLPGQQITIPQVTQPPPAATVPYTIQPGDTLFSIARRFGTTVENLLRLNPTITDPSRIFPGQQILVPAPPTAVPPGCIIYISTRSGRPEIWRTNAAGQGTVQITRESGTATQPVNNPQWAPNGRFIAYQAVGALFVIDPCGRNPRQIAPNVSNFSWSNDSTKLAFSNTEGTYITDLSGNIRKVTGEMFSPVWFPGDQRLAGIVPEEPEGIRFAHLATVDVTGANFKVIEPPVPAGKVKISPNGRYAATELMKGYGYGVFSTVTVYDFTTGNQVQLPGFEIQVGTTISFVHDVSYLGGWAPDSSRLVYSTILNEQGLGELRIANPQGTILLRFNRSYYPFPGNWGPTADWIIFTVSEQSGTTAFQSPAPRDIYVHNLSTNQEIRVAGPEDLYSPDWSGAACPPC